MNMTPLLDTAERSAAAEIARVGMCGSCGKHPKVPGFEMCVACRTALNLPVPKTRKKAEPREGKTMGAEGKRKRHYCSCGFTHGWGTHMQQHLEANPDHHAVDGPATPTRDRSKDVTNHDQVAEAAARAGSTVLPAKVHSATTGISESTQTLQAEIDCYPEQPEVMTALESVSPDYRSELVDALLIITRASHDDPAIPSIAIERLAELAKGAA